MVALVKPDNPMLRATAGEVLAGEASGIIKQLRQICANAPWGNCVGMAGPQIGISKRVFIADNRAYINPTITWQSDDTDRKIEGCYSVKPETYYPIKRSQSIIITWTGARGVQHTTKLYGRAARVVQHEYDHLNGILITDKTMES